MSKLAMIKEKYASYLTSSLFEDNKGNINALLPVGRMVYPDLFVATNVKGETDDLKKRYQITLLLPAEADIRALRERIQAIYEKEVPAAQRKFTKWRDPISDTSSEPRFAEFADEYPFFVRPNSRMLNNDGRKRDRPAIKYIKDGAVVEASSPPDDDFLYNGRWARVCVNPYWYPAKQGPAGVSLALLSTQVLWNDRKLQVGAGGIADTSSQYEVVEGLDETPEVDEYA